MQLAAVAISLLGGFIPALFWLWFWLREDKARPEPKSLIATAFFAGMAIVLLVLPLQRFAISYYTETNLVLVWVVVEEVLKYAAALVVVLWHRTVDEPVDVIIYMITIALGFSGLENALFIFTPLLEGHYVESILTGHFRFLGATLLHVLASGTVGSAMALSFYKKRNVRIIWSTIGLCAAIVLHTLFNFFIIDGSGETILTVFLFVWMGIIALFLVFEKAKLLEKRRRR